MKQRNAGRCTYILLAVSLLLFFCSGCGKNAERTTDTSVSPEGGGEGGTNAAGNSGEWNGFTIEERVALTYATMFQIDKLSGGCRRITISGQEYLIVPENAEVTGDLPEEITVIRQSKEKLYVASSSAMSFFQALSALDRVGFTSTKAADWTEEEIRKAVESEDITYVGKYNAPDYEWLMQEGAGLAVENTMLLHSPKTKEQLEQLGIPVLIEYSSYESHPMGRLEWVRVYGCLLGMEAEAEEYFRKEDERFRALTGKPDGEGTSEQPSQGAEDAADHPRVAYFYMNPSGYVSVQRTGSYVAEMIRLAGGDYFLSKDDGDATEGTGSMNLQTDRFYEEAKDADILIYNGAIYGPPESLDLLVEEYPLLKDFKAVQSGNVYTTGDNLFQGVTHMNNVLEELIGIVTGEGTDGVFFRKLR